MSRIQLVEFKQTTEACPEQWEGKTADGQHVYVRERHGWFRVDLDGVTVHASPAGDNFDVFEATAHLFDFPKEAT